MKDIYKNILLQGWMFDPLELMNKEERKDYINSLVESALAGKVITDNPKWIRFIEKALSSIEETRDKYNRRQAKNAEYGILGKEYGILGKKYGKLGGRPRKGETKEQYKERKRLENEALISEKKSIYTIAEEFAKERKEKATKEELDVLEQMEELGIPNIEFQKPVFIKDENGKPYKFYIADFLDTKNKIDIEIDGGYHTTEDQKMKDSIRDDDFREIGYDIFRITNDQVNSGKAMGLFKDFYRKRQIATTFNV